MRVHVTLKGSLAERLPGGTGEVELPEGSTVASLGRVLGLTGWHCVVVVNGAAAVPEALLAEGDRVQVFPPVAGGSGAVGPGSFGGPRLAAHDGSVIAPPPRRRGVRRRAAPTQGPCTRRR